MNPISKSLVAAVLLCSCIGHSQTIPIIEWDFRDGLQDWKGYEISKPAETAEGITFEPIHFAWSFNPIKLGGSIEGPAVDLPIDHIIRVVIRMKTTAGRFGNLYYHLEDDFLEHQGKDFSLQNDGQFHDYEMFILDPPGAGTHFTVVPSDSLGSYITMQSITVESMPRISVSFDQPIVPGGRNPKLITSGVLEIRHYGQRLGNFQVNVNNHNMAVGYQSELLGLKKGDTTEWINLGQQSATLSVEKDGSLTVRTTFKEDDVNWTIERNFLAGNSAGSILVTSRFSVDQDRQVILLPWLTLYAGLGSFGSQKYQGLLPGLEYLSARDSSSNQKAIVTVEHKRRVPDPIKVTIPMMVIAQNEHYVGLIWEPSELTNALFDSPDRVTNANAHLLGITGPAVGPHRFENELAAFRSYTLIANQTYSENVTIIGGKGKTVVPAVQHYVDIKTLPEQSVIEGGLEKSTDLIAHSWLDSEIRNGTGFGGVVWMVIPQDPPTEPDSDALLYMDWLRTATSDAHLAKRLQEVRDSTLAAFDSNAPYVSRHAHISVRLPHRCALDDWKNSSMLLMIEPGMVFQILPLKEPSPSIREVEDRSCFRPIGPITPMVRAVAF